MGSRRLRKRALVAAGGLIVVGVAVLAEAIRDLSDVMQRLEQESNG